MKRTKESIRMITEGAIYVAVYAMLAIISRYLITATDSMLYYIYPLPLAVFTARQKIGAGITVFLASLALGFLFANPIIVLTIFIPNLLVGLLFGFIVPKQFNNLIKYISIFVLLFIGDILSIVAFEKISGVGYFDDMIPVVNNISKLFGLVIDTDFLMRIIRISGMAVLMIDSVIKEVLLFLVFTLIVVRLKLIKDYKPSFKIVLNYSPLLSGFFIMIFVLLVLVMNLYMNNPITILEIIFVLLISIFFLLCCYMLYQAAMFVRIKFMNISTGIMILILLLMVILFPLSALIGFILNLIRWNFVNESLK